MEIIGNKTTVWLSAIFNISSFVLNRRKKLMQIWNSLWVSKLCNFHFWVNYPFKLEKKRKKKDFFDLFLEKNEKSASVTNNIKAVLTFTDFIKQRFNSKNTNHDLKVDNFRIML